MINRQLIRFKAIQIFYAYAINASKTTEEAEKEFATSLERAHDLYLYLLNFLIDIRRHAELLAETIEARNKRLGLRIEASSAERVLANNKWLLTLANNTELLDYRSHHNDRTDEERAVCKRLTTNFLENEDFLLYLKKEDRSPEADQEISRRLYKTVIAFSEEFEPLLEERSLYWNDDKAIIDTFVLKTIKRISPDGSPNHPLLPAWDEDEDRKFALHLFHEALRLKGETYALIESFSSKKWDIDRTPFMDIVILQVAIAELLGVPEIPVSITLNEYINVAKWYSTPQSASYINAMLDAIAKDLRKKGRLMKPVN